MFVTFLRIPTMIAKVTLGVSFARLLICLFCMLLPILQVSQTRLDFKSLYRSMVRVTILASGS
ncbi:hypothetical protein CBI55_26295 [Pseudomonas syringae]|nr:hypothetical protein CBI55_26295 [Pseudomonas syringae]